MIAFTSDGLKRPANKSL